MLDLDGVLCNFDYQVGFYKARKDNGKVDWKLLKNIGSAFWSSMPWLEEGQKLYNGVLDLKKSYPDIEIGIASAIFLSCGKRGKRYWIEQNCPEIAMKNVIITDKGVDKWLELDEGDILIDDNKENIECLDGTIPEAWGILFTTAEVTLCQLKNLLEEIKAKEIEE